LLTKISSSFFLIIKTINSKLLFFFIILTLAFSIHTLICYANAAEPPSILIIVFNAPEDLEISMGSVHTLVKAKRTDKLFESYYTFYSMDIKTAGDYTIKVATGNSSFEISLDKPLKYYNNIYTLDLKNQTLTPGKSLVRSSVLVSARVIFTLLIEGIVFYLFGYRQKRSWIAFILINLGTQGALNIWINGASPLQSYIILSLIFAEIRIFIVESFAYLVSVKERNSLITFLYVIVANFLSLVAGGYLITKLPI